MTEFAVIDPASGEFVRGYPTIDDAELASAVEMAYSTSRNWMRTTPAIDRGAMLHRVAELHLERREELARALVREMGKPIAQARGEIEFAADIYRYYADRAAELTADEPIELRSSSGDGVVRRLPLGVLLGIMPWNFPYYQVARFAGPNLLLGNAILLKHAAQCPDSALAIADMFRSAGFPDGAYTNIFASVDQISVLLADSRLAGVSLTGSERAGSAVAEQAGRNLKKVVLELGGSDPFILLSTDDLDAAVEAAVAARMDNNGQSCNAAKRFIVISDLYDAFVAGFVARLATIRPSDPMLEDCELGPLSSAAAADRLEGQIDSAVAQGATLLLGGTRSGNFIGPTVLAEVEPDNGAYQVEFFGPVAMVFRVQDEDAAVALANDTSFGLGSYVYTTDPAQADRVAEALDVGMVYVNVVLADAAELPFGGVKRSGFGREMGTLAIEEFMNKKLIRRAP